MDWLICGRIKWRLNSSLRWGDATLWITKWTQSYSDSHHGIIETKDHEIPIITELILAPRTCFAWFLKTLLIYVRGLFICALEVTILFRFPSNFAQIVHQTNPLIGHGIHLLKSFPYKLCFREPNEYWYRKLPLVPSLAFFYWHLSKFVIF